MRLIINGANGKTGKALCEYIECGDAHFVAAYVDRGNITDKKARRFTSISEYDGEADCIIDFSHRSQTQAVCSYAVNRHLPLVIATTGQDERDMEIIKAASKFVPLMKSANLSREIKSFGKLVENAARLFPDADTELVELHNREKSDKPSGTALLLAARVQKARTSSSNASDRMEIHSLRLGESYGKHTVCFAKNGQLITLTHESNGRHSYVVGAVEAAVFLYGRKPGLFTENDLYNEA